jgi:hypothetical protein
MIVTYLMTPAERAEFDPIEFTEKLKAAGFILDRDTCPIKIRKPYEEIHQPDGSVLWRQFQERVQ